MYLLYFVCFFQLSDVLECEESIRYFAKKEQIFAAILRKWIKIKEIHKILNILYEITISSQKFDLTLSDFYGCWLLSHIKLRQFPSEQCETNLVQMLLFALNKRKPALLDNTFMLCALFLDLRYKVELTSQQNDLAKRLITDAWIKLQELKSHEEIVEDNAIGELHKDDETDLIESYFIARGFESLIDNEENNARQSNLPTPDLETKKQCLLLELQQFECLTRLHHTVSILQFWEEKNAEFPELYSVAFMFNGIPPSQSTIERNFSALTMIFNCRRSRLSDPLLESILLIKLNVELANSIFTEEREEIIAENDVPEIRIN